MSLHSDDLDLVIPPEVRARSLRVGTEWVLAFDDALEICNVADKQMLAILGVEVFKILEDGIKSHSCMSDYLFECEKWEPFVRRNNVAAKAFVQKQAFRQGYGYVFTAISEPGFKNLGNQKNG